MFADYLLLPQKIIKYIFTSALKEKPLELPSNSHTHTHTWMRLYTYISS